MLREVWAGDRRSPAIRDVRGAELGLLWVLAAGILVLGLYPVLLLDLTAVDASRVTWVLEWVR